MFKLNNFGGEELRVHGMWDRGRKETNRVGGEEKKEGKELN